MRLHAQSALWLQCARIVGWGSALLASVLLARLHGASSLGSYAFLVATAAVAQGVTSLGLEDFVVVRGSRAGSVTPEAVGLYVRALRQRAVAILLLVVTAVGVALLDQRVSIAGADGFALGLAVLYGALNSLATVGAAIKTAQVRGKQSAVIDTAWGIVTSAGFAAVAIAGTLTVTAVFEVMVIAQGLASVAYLVLLADVIPWFGATRSSAHRVSHRETATYWVNTLLSFGVGRNSDVLAMQVAAASAAAVGVYTAAYNVNLFASQLLVQGAGTAFSVGLGQVFRHGSPTEIAKAWRRTTIAAILLSVPLLVYTIVIPWVPIGIVYGSKGYPGGSACLVILALTSAITRLLGGGSNQALLFLDNRQGQVLVVRTLLVVVNMIFDVLGYWWLGVAGVALSSGVTGVAIAGLEYWLCHRRYPLRLPVASFVKVGVPYALVAAAMFWVPLSGRGGDLVSVIVVMLGGTALLYLVKPLRHDDLPESMSGSLQRILGPLRTRRSVNLGGEPT